MKIAAPKFKITKTEKKMHSQCIHGLFQCESAVVSFLAP